MKVRHATLADYAEVMALYGDFVGDDRFAGPNNDSYKQVVESPSNHLYVAEADGKLVGFASLSIRRVVRYPTPIAELDELYVDPAGRHHGTGRQLMAAVEADAKQQGCRRVYIESQYKHTDGHKFYEALGYTNNGYHFRKDL